MYSYHFFIELNLLETFKFFISLQIQLIDFLSSSFCNYMFTCLYVYVCVCVCVFCVCNVFLCLYVAVCLCFRFWRDCCQKIMSFRICIRLSVQLHYFKLLMSRDPGVRLLSESQVRTYTQLLRYQILFFLALFKFCFVFVTFCIALITAVSFVVAFCVLHCGECYWFQF